jgi:guanylate kinase
VSYTTREPRPDERHGFDYFFISKDTFHKEIQKNNLLEHNQVHDNLYGTHREVVASIIRSGKICLLDIDLNGVRMAVQNGLKASNRIFIMPPSLEILKKRLEERGTDSAETINKRIAKAGKEIELAHQLNLFHYFITNDDKDIFLPTATKLIEDCYPFIIKQKT